MKAKGLTAEQQNVLRNARSVIRDMASGWPEKSLAESPRSVCDKLSALLGERYDFVSGDVLDGSRRQ